MATLAMHRNRTEAKPISTFKNTGRTVGILFIVATVAGIVGLGMTDSILQLQTSGSLGALAANESQILVGMLLELVMGLAVFGISITAYPVLKRYSASLALGYAGARLVEAVICIIDVLGILMMLTLSRAFLAAGSPTSADFPLLNDVLASIRSWGGHGIGDAAVFSVGALAFYFVLYRSKLVPRWLSGWGLVGAVLYLAAGVLVLLSIIPPQSSTQLTLDAPLGLQEMMLAIWLIVKGFNVSAAPESGESE